MAQYIDKDALITEIERLRRYQRLDNRHDQGVLDGLHTIEKFLDKLEVKEVDLDNKGEWENTGGFGSTWDPDSPDYYPD